MNETSPGHPAAPSPGGLPPGLRTMVKTLCLDVGLPVAAYFVAELLGASTYVALLSGTLVAGLRLAWVAIRERRLDVFAMFLLFIYGAGLALTFFTGDARFALAKDSAMSFTAGLIFVGSCVIGRPLAYYAALRFAGSDGEAEIRATTESGMRERWTRTSLVWGCGLLADAVLRIVAIYVLPINVAAGVSQVLMLLAYAGLIGWTVHAAKRAHAKRATLTV